MQKVLGAAALLKEAYDQMVTGRKSTTKNAVRGARYYWQYGEGKKTAVKVGIGLAVSGAFVGVGLATHGLGIPVVIGLATAALVVNKSGEFAFAKLSGREYRGVGRNLKWEKSYRPPKTAKGMRPLEERAHETVRRAYQHYLTAWVKAQPLRGNPLPDEFRTYNDAVQKVTEILHVVRHLEKAQLYIHPAIYLAREVLGFYDWFRQNYDNEPGRVREEWHQDQPCDSTTCYLNYSVPTQGSDLPIKLWTQQGVNAIKSELERAEEQVKRDVRGAMEDARESAKGVRGRTGPKEIEFSTRLNQYAEDKYDRNIGTKMWHGITNDWERMTVEQRNDFVVSQVVSVGATVLSGGVGAGEVLHGFEPLFEVVTDFLELTITEVIDQSGSDGGDLHDIRIPRVSATKGAESQESLRHAALHLLEVYKIHNSIERETIITCDPAVDYFRKIYKIHYHLSKTEGHLGKTIEKVTKLTERIGKDIDFLKAYSREIQARVYKLGESATSNKILRNADGRYYFATH